MYGDYRAIAETWSRSKRVFYAAALPLIALIRFRGAFGSWREWAALVDEVESAARAPVRQRPGRHRRGGGLPPGPRRRRAIPRAVRALPRPAGAHGRPRRLRVLSPCPRPPSPSSFHAREAREAGAVPWASRAAGASARRLRGGRGGRRVSHGTGWHGASARADARCQAREAGPGGTRRSQEPRGAPRALSLPGVHRRRLRAPTRLARRAAGGARGIALRGGGRHGEECRGRKTCSRPPTRSCSRSSRATSTSTTARWVSTRRTTSRCRATAPRNWRVQ